MKISAIYDQGYSPYREDGLVMRTRLFGVLDSVSKPYAPKYPLRKLDGLTGGEVVARFCENHLHSPHFCIDRNLRSMVQELNEELNRKQLNALLEPSTTEPFAGATFTLARITEKMIEVLQAGDCMAVVELKSGEIIVSPNQVRAHDTEMNMEIERIQREVAQEMFGLTLENVPQERREQVRAEMWNRFYPILMAARRRDVNRRESPKGYGILNGQPELLNLIWERAFRRSEVATLLLFSDGMVPWTVMKSADDIEIGRTVLAESKRRGLAGLLLSARSIEEQTVTTSYTNQAEATAIAIVF